MTTGILTLTGNGALDVAKNGTATGTLDLGALNDGGTARTITINPVNNGTVALNSSANTMNTPGDAIIVNGGTLLLTNTTGSATGTSMVNVNATGDLAGTGSFSGTLTSNSGGTVAPGISSGSTGILSTGNVFLGAGSTFASVLNGTTAGSGYDQLNVSGTINIGNATLRASIGYAAATGDSYTIISSTGGVTGTFNGLSNNASSPSTVTCCG